MINANSGSEATLQAAKLPFVLSYAGDQQGCGWHRVMCPSAGLMRAGLAYVRAATALVEPGVLTRLKPDVILWQHQAEDSQLDYMHQLRVALPNCQFVFEIDDHLAAVDESNWHEAFIGPPEEMERRTAKALEMCDRAVVPTAGLKDWLESLSDRPVTVMPNYLPELDGGPRVAIKKRPAGHRVRIAWSGGISHGGDLSVMGDVVAETRRLLKAAGVPERHMPVWIFQGMKPPGIDPADYEWHEGIAPAGYANMLASLDVDLALAPLVDTPFNRCKSNLRIIQGGAMGAAVLASPVGEYLDCKEAIWRYAADGNWAKEIVAFVVAPDDVRRRARQRAQKWAAGWSMAANVEAVAEAWGLPPRQASKLPKPTRKKEDRRDWIVCGLEVESIAKSGAVLDRLDDPIQAYARARETGAGLVVARPGTWLSAASWTRLAAGLATQLNRPVASASVWSNDGACGAGLFQEGKFFQTSEEIGDELSRTMAAESKSVKPESIRLPFPLGPLAVLTPQAVQQVEGWPEGGFAEALAEWGLVAGAAGMEHLLVPGAWATAGQQETGLDGALVGARGIPFSLVQGSLQSPPAREWKQHVELAHIRRTHEVPAPPGQMGQVLETWTAYYAGAKDETRTGQSVARIICGEPEADEYLTRARAAGVKWVRWDFQGGLLSDGAVADLEEAGDRERVDFVYADWMAAIQDKGALPVFLPADFDWHYGLARDFFTATLIMKLEVWKGPAPVSRLAVWKQVMQAIREITTAKPSTFHIAKTMGVSTEEPAVVERKAVIEAEWPSFEVEPLGEAGIFKVRKRLSGRPPSVSVVVPTTGDPWLLRPMLATMGKHTDYAGKVEKILVLSGDPEAIEESKARIAKIKEAAGALIVECPGPFNFAKACNLGVGRSSGEVLVFANDDTRYPHDKWLEGLVALTTEPRVGWVGPRIMDQGGNLQCAGVYAGRGFAGEIYRGLPGNEIGFGGFAHALHAVGAVTACCAAIEAQKFRVIGGFPESLAYNFNDVAAGIETRRRGWVNLYSPHSDVMHAMSSTRGKEDAKRFLARLREEGKVLEAGWAEPDTTWPDAFQVTSINRKVMISGLAYDSLAWPGPGADAPMVLVVGRDLQTIAHEIKAGNRVLVAFVQSGKLQLINPVLANHQPLALDDEKGLRHLFEALRVTRIVEGPVVGDEAVLPDWVATWNHKLAGEPANERE